MRKVKYQVYPLVDISNHLVDYKLVDLSIGPKNELCTLYVSQIPGLLDGMFPQSKTETEYDYKICVFSNDYEISVDFKNQKWNYHFLQPIYDDNYLLACARARLYKNKSYDLNAKVIDNNGQIVKEFLVGDGIQSLKVTSENTIWTSYFDEGVFGNFGWTEPIGSYGLRSWSSRGDALYKYPNSDPHFIVDCYAMNVINNNQVWFYFYDTFELGWLNNGILEFFQTEIQGSDCFVVNDDYFLFRGGYNKQDDYFLYKLERNQLKKVLEMELIDETGLKIESKTIDYRGSLILLLHDSKIYKADLREILKTM